MPYPTDPTNPAATGPTLDIAKFKGMIDQMRQLSQQLRPPVAPATAAPDPDALHAKITQDEATRVPAPAAQESHPADPDAVHAQVSQNESGGGFWNWLNKPVTDYTPAG